MAITSPSPGSIIAIAAVFYAIQATAVAARFWSRRKNKVHYGVDDYFVLAASIAYTAVFTVPVIIGAAGAELGTHLKISPTGEPELPSPTFDDIQFIFITFHVIVLGLARASILLLYKRIFIGPRFEIVIWTLLAWTAGWTISFFFAFLFHCTPVSTATFPSPNAKCVDELTLTKVLGVTSVLSDLFILLVPLPLVHRLHLSLPQRVGVGIIFMLGNLTLAASIVRCVILIQIDAKLKTGIPDFPYYDGANIVWALLESTMAIVCSCLPAMGRYIWRGLPDRLRSGASRIRFLLYYRRRQTDTRLSSNTDNVSLEPINASPLDTLDAPHKGFHVHDVSQRQIDSRTGVEDDMDHV